MIKIPPDFEVKRDDLNDYLANLAVKLIEAYNKGQIHTARDIQRIDYRKASNWIRDTKRRKDREEKSPEVSIADLPEKNGEYADQKMYSS